MNIQSLSIAVPAKCGNKCKFCVGIIHNDMYTNQIEENTRFLDLYERDYINKMAYARDNGCNSVMLSGDGEPLLNKNFLKAFANYNKQLESPFRQIELQTSGMLLDDEYLRFLRNTVGISIISLSLSALDTAGNIEYNAPKNKKFEVDIPMVCSEIKRYDFSLRLSLNLTDKFNDLSPEDIFTKAKELGANQLTFRVLYDSGGTTKEDVWIRKHRCNETKLTEITDYVLSNGRALYRLPYGQWVYSVDGMSVIVDDDCMATEVSNNLKYLILRQDAKLYSHWSDKGSLLF